MYYLFFIKEQLNMTFSSFWVCCTLNITNFKKITRQDKSISSIFWVQQRTHQNLQNFV